MLFEIFISKFLSWHDKLKKAKIGLIFPLKYLHKIFKRQVYFGENEVVS